jgi:hypothetical protein
MSLKSNRLKILENSYIITNITKGMLFVLYLDIAVQFKLQPFQPICF